MASTGFVAVTWSPNQLIDEDSLDQINNNLIFLRDKTVSGKYQLMNGGTVTTGVKILCGRALVTPNPKGDSRRIRVTFNSMFTANTAPIITTSIISTHQTNVFVTLEGIGRTHPNHQGFIAKINVAYDLKKNDIVRSMYLHWQAMGY